MTIQEAKDNLLKEVNTPFGILTLYGINLLPNDGKFENTGFWLSFYIKGEREMCCNIDCSIISS